MFGSKPRHFPDADMPKPSVPLIEPLESRELLSASTHHAHADSSHVASRHKAVHVAKEHHRKSSTGSASTTSTGSTGSTTTSLLNIPVGFGGGVEGTITFAQAPSAVQTGLTTLAITDGQAAPTTDQSVYLGNSGGDETFTLHYDTTGTDSSITVDQNGNPVAKATHTTMTFADLTASDPTAAAEITAIAAAKDQTAPTDTTTVDVSTKSSGTITYSVHLSSTGSTGTAVPVASSTLTAAIGGWGGAISVDSAGNPVGNQNIPFTVLPASLQSAINANVPAGSTTLATTSTQSVKIQTFDGVTLYTATFDSTGIETRITVNEAGTLTSQPTTTTTTFSALSSTVQGELQTLATADGVTTTITASQSVTVYTEPNGAVIYAVSLSTSSGTTSSGSTSDPSDGGWGDTITIAVDASGNPTIPPVGGFGDGFGGGGGGGWGGPGGGPTPFDIA